MEMFAFFINYTNSLNGEAGTPDPHFSLWGELRGLGLAYAGIWTAFAIALLALLWLIHATKQSYHSSRWWQTRWLEQALQWFLYAFYMPFLIAILRPLACSWSTFHQRLVMDHDTAQVDHSLISWEGGRGTVVWFGGLGCLGGAGGAGWSEAWRLGAPR
jgi:hypothetical protein